MHRATVMSRSMVVRTSTTASAYPLQRRFVEWGLWSGVVGGLLFASAVAGFAFVTLFLCLGMLWRRDELPVLPFCLAYQWVGATAGFFFQQLSGYYPRMEVGDIDYAVFLSMIGFLVMTVGYRHGIRLFGRTLTRAQHRPAMIVEEYSPRRLFCTWLVMGLVMGFLLQGAAMGVWFEGAQWISRLREFVDILLVLLLLVVLRQDRNYGYIVAAVLWSWVSALPSAGSVIAAPFLLLAPLLLGEWRPWEKNSPRFRVRNRRIALCATLCAAGLLVAYLVWEGGLKSAWRPLVLSGKVQGSLSERLGMFTATARDAILTMDWKAAPEELAGRASSGAGYFSHVVERIPEVFPYEGGILTLRALQHVTMPRVLFPDKPNLGSDSWLIREYAGLPAAGFEEGTSIGLGYMAQFYIDFGVPGMFVPLFIYGALIGVIYILLYVYAPSMPFFLAATATLFPGFLLTYDGEIAKILGGLLTAAIVFGVLLRFLAPLLHQWFLLPGSEMVRRKVCPTVCDLGLGRSLPNQ